MLPRVDTIEENLWGGITDTLAEDVEKGDRSVTQREERIHKHTHLFLNPSD